MTKEYTELDEVVDDIAAAISEGIPAGSAIEQVLTAYSGVARVDVLKKFQDVFACDPATYQVNELEDAEWLKQHQEGESNA